MLPLGGAARRHVGRAASRGALLIAVPVAPLCGTGEGDMMPWFRPNHATLSGTRLSAAHECLGQDGRSPLGGG